MAMLEEFTVADLVQICDAPAATVRTVLRRNDSLIEPVGQEETGRPGGRWKRYRLRAEAHEGEFGGLLAGAPARGATASGGIPTGLLAAEELLLDTATARVDDQERASLLRRAKRFRREGEIDRSKATGAAQGHRHAVDALISLVEGEGAEDTALLERAREQALTARLLLHEHDPLNFALARRIADSPLRDLSPETTHRPIPVHRPGARIKARSILADIAGVLAGTQAVGAVSIGGTPRIASAYGTARPTGRGMARKARARAEAPRKIAKTKVAGKRTTLRASKLDAVEAAELRHHDLVAWKS